MSTYEYDRRLDAIEKDIAGMKHDIIEKLHDTNSAVGIIRGLLWKQEQGQRVLVHEVKGLDIRLEGIEVQVDNLTQDVKTIKEQQNEQGKDIKDIKSRLDTIEQNVNKRFETQDKKLDQLMTMLIALTNKP